MGPSSVAAAIVIQEGLSQAAVKALLITLAFFVTGPILTHITARAILARESSGENPRRSEGMRKGE
jgi:multisubunit Na+/H+ antiporter MnhG subunit